SADAQGLGGMWRAWLADSKTAAPDRIFAPNGGYVLLDGTLIASSLAALVVGPLAHPIDRSEKNAPITDGNTEVWTGWDPGAGTFAGTCNNGGGDWTSAK